MHDSASAPHIICHCFGHSRESLRAEYEAKGSISAVVEVVAKVRAGECRCEELNPKGVCCLTDLRREVLAIMGLPKSPAGMPRNGCESCSDSSSDCESCGC